MSASGIVKQGSEKMAPGVTLFVLGMHRSGTSAMTGVLDLCGAWAGNETELTQASVENPRGFWERQDIREICDKLLQSVGADWWKIAGFDTKAIPRTMLFEQRRKFQKIISTRDEHETWVVKEPRLCLLLPVLRHYARNPVCIYMYRNPLEVARSLQTRNGFSISSGLALWEVYNLHALNASEGLPRIFVSFEELMFHPLETTRMIAEKLEELVGSHTVKPERKLLQQFIDPKLYRQKVTEEETRDYLLPSQQALWSCLRKDEALDNYKNIPISEAARQSLLDLESVEVSFELHRDAVNELRTTISKYTAALKSREERYTAALKGREERIDALEGSNNRLKANLEQHEETILRYTAALKSRKERYAAALKSRKERYTAALNARDKKIEDLYDSTSWKITAPLRAVSLGYKWLLRNLTRRQHENAKQVVNSGKSNPIIPVSTRAVTPLRDITYIMPSSWWDQNPKAASFITKTAQAVIVLGGNRITTCPDITAVAGVEERVLALAAVTTGTAVEIRADAKWTKAVENGELPQDGSIKVLTPDDLGREIGRY